MAQNLVEYVLDIKTKAAEKGMKSLSKSVDIAGKGLAGLKTAAIAVTGATVALTGAIGVAVKEVTDLVNELNDLSVRSGLATDTISGLRFALIASGQSAEGLNEILGAISGQFAQLSTEGSAVEKKFQSFGIAVRDTNGVLRSNNDILIDVIKNITGLQDPSERSRRAVALVGEAGSKLNQALAAGDFEKFVQLTNEFGVRVAPKASTEAANLQRNISALNSILAGTTQRFTEAIGGSERFNQILQVLIGVMGGVSRVIEQNSVFLGHLTDAIFEAGASSLDFFAGFLTGSKSASQGLQGLVENIFIVGQAIIRRLISPLANFLHLSIKLSEFLDLEMTSSLKNLQIRMQELGRNLDINADEGFINFANFGEASAEVLDLLSQTSLNASSSLSNFSSSMIEAGEETGVTTQKIRTLTDVVNDLLGRFIGFDALGILQDVSLVLKGIETLAQGSADRIGGFIRNVGFSVANTVFDFLFALQDKGLDRLAISINKLANPLSKIADKFANAIGGSIGALSTQSGKIANKFSDIVKAGSEKGLVGAFQTLGTAGKVAAGLGAVIFGAIKIAEGVGGRARSAEEIREMQRRRREEGKAVSMSIAEIQQRDIEKSIEEDIRARAKAIEIGLRALPKILFEVLPPLFVEFADRVVFGFFKSIAEFVGILKDFFRSIFTREGRQERKEARDRRQEARGEEFRRRLEQLVGIAGFRSGGRYIPSARGGIKFTGSDEGLAMLHRGEFVVPETGQMPQAVQRTMGMGQGGMTININAAVVESNAVDELVRQIERRFQTFGSSTSPLFGGR
jgi:hypothetical protein